jgi:cytochrome c oxidase accessory protein FixG
MREQVCTIVCPYGRLQSVMLDTKTLVVAYDYKRGEPREKWGKKRNDTAGDCINCAQCVEVCPTGIDIRDGVQLECINCTACIDACDSVMKKIGKAPNLVGYQSMDGIEKGEKFRLNTRRKLYISLICVLVTGLILLLSNRSDVQADILRTRGMTYIEKPNGSIENIYNVKLLNKTFKTMPVTLKLENIKGNIETMGAADIVAPSEEVGEGIIAITIPADQLKEADTEIKIGIYADGKLLHVTKTTFMGPWK